MPSPKSSKAKGRRLQNMVRDKLRAAFSSSLEEDDIKSQTMGMTGEDIVLSPAARKLIPYSIECKNVERLNVWQCLKQTESNVAEGCAPALVIKRNQTNPYIMVPLEIWIDIISNTDQNPQK